MGITPKFCIFELVDIVREPRSRRLFVACLVLPLRVRDPSEATCLCNLFLLGPSGCLGSPASSPGVIIILQ